MYLKKNDTNIHIRVSQDLKDRFLEACVKNRRKYSDIIRKLMRNYIAENSEVEMHG